MPWTPGDAGRFTKKAKKRKRVQRQWAAVANSILQRCVSEGRPEKECAASAVRQANGVVAHDEPPREIHEDDEPDPTQTEVEESRQFLDDLGFENADEFEDFIDWLESLSQEELNQIKADISDLAAESPSPPVNPGLLSEIQDQMVRESAPTDRVTDYYNKYHDARGRFASRPGGRAALESSSDKDRINEHLTQSGFTLDRTHGSGRLTWRRADEYRDLENPTARTRNQQNGTVTDHVDVFNDGQWRHRSNFNGFDLDRNASVVAQGRGAESLNQHLSVFDRLINTGDNLQRYPDSAMAKMWAVKSAGVRHNWAIGESYTVDENNQMTGAPRFGWTKTIGNSKHVVHYDAADDTWKHYKERWTGERHLGMAVSRLDKIREGRGAENLAREMARSLTLIKHSIADYYNKYHDRRGRFASRPGGGAGLSQGAPEKRARAGIKSVISNYWRSSREYRYLHSQYWHDVSYTDNIQPPKKFGRNEAYQVYKKKHGAYHVVDIAHDGKWAYHKRLPDGRVLDSTEGVTKDQLRTLVKAKGLSSPVSRSLVHYGTLVAINFGVAALNVLMSPQGRAYLTRRYEAWRQEHDPPAWPWRSTMRDFWARRHGVTPPVVPWPQPLGVSRQIAGYAAEDDLPEDPEMDAVSVDEDELERFMDWLDSLTPEQVARVLEGSAGITVQEGNLTVHEDKDQ